MGQLFFKKPLQDAILLGRKVTTIRRWDRPRVRAGGRAWAAGVGWLAVDAVETVALADLTEADAAADGFDSLAALLAVLRELYPAAMLQGPATEGAGGGATAGGDGKQWFRVRFRLTEPSRAVAGPTLFEA
ncbi:MAG: hypothetical protein JWO31_4106 [Phycisphaerales bacterium]|nr:hypothetical protein [Phycisphaerales bacterium]